MGVRCRDCGRESRLEPQCLERPSTPLIQLLFSCKSYQHFLLTPTITPHSWALFSLFTAHQGEGREKTEGRARGGVEKSETYQLLILTDRVALPPTRRLSPTHNSFPGRPLTYRPITSRYLIYMPGYCLWQRCCNILHPSN